MIIARNITLVSKIQCVIDHNCLVDQIPTISCAVKVCSLEAVYYVILTNNSTTHIILQNH